MLGVINKYLATYAEEEIQSIDFPEGSFDHALVIPAYNEDASFLDAIRLQRDPNLLFIAVINKPESAAHPASKNTLQLLQELQSKNHRNLLIIDRVTRPIPSKEGVGLARKIGTDIAVQLYASGKVKSPWIRQTDADASLDDRYLKVAMPAKGAVVFSHKHMSANTLVANASVLYDAHMSYYVEALRSQHSFFAFPTLGSTIAVHAKSYAEVRGYPKRNAGEDFYLLNKIAKSSGVIYSKSSLVTIQARLSERVPFGTGPALRKIVDQLTLDPSGKSFLSYDYNSFILLGKALQQLHYFAESPIEFESQINSILTTLGFLKIGAKLHKKSRSQKQRHFVLNQWFDGFRTMRFIHEARTIYPDKSLLTTMSELPEEVRHEILIKNPEMKGLLTI